MSCDSQTQLIWNLIKWNAPQFHLGVFSQIVKRRQVSLPIKFQTLTETIFSALAYRIVRVWLFIRKSWTRYIFRDWRKTLYWKEFEQKAHLKCSTSYLIPKSKLIWNWLSSTIPSITFVAFCCLWMMVLTKRALSRQGFLSEGYVQEKFLCLQSNLIFWAVILFFLSSEHP